MTENKLYFEDVSSILELIEDIKPEFNYRTTKSTEHVGYEVHFTETVWFRGTNAGVMWITIPLKDYGSEEEVAEEARKALREKKKELLQEERQEEQRKRQERKIEREGREKAGELNDLIGAPVSELGGER
ncbi:hypothetical protein AKJ38_03085 [candidate division MSBL1 archaeon SCGC-AAA259I14]|uniref:Uncharacterized protein n=1 Tax=candidate division MSBL1 archaeon SCGC-AAA259I14 TaxID=1698268 RepID=A0A133UQU4_9EURY|nr:hypothetical protein AKJ38_03085 [candidate division MSBL1 archaeon SCGC-AAA259I14]